jgi:hypothetical protein
LQRAKDLIEQEQAEIVAAAKGGVKDELMRVSRGNLESRNRDTPPAGS